MSKIVDEFPAGVGRLPVYPYEEWLDGNIHALEQGEDFKVSPEGMRSSLHNYCKGKGIKAKTKIRDGIVYVQALPIEDDEPED